MTTRLLLLLLLVAAAQGKATGRSWESRVKCFSQTHQNGRWHEFTNAVPDLDVYNLGNTIASVKVNGIWIFYDHEDYNTHRSGTVCWAHGIDFEGDLPYHCRNMAMSLRYAGSPFDINQDSWTVYDGTYFTGEVLHGYSDIYDLNSMSNRVSSLILTGSSSWTFYDQTWFSGNGICFRPNTIHDEQCSQTLDLGIWPELGSCQLLDNRIRSVRRGCWSNEEIRCAELEVVQRTANGAMGYIKT